MGSDYSTPQPPRQYRNYAYDDAYDNAYGARDEDSVIASMVHNRQTRQPPPRQREQDANESSQSDFMDPPRRRSPKAPEKRRREARDAKTEEPDSLAVRGLLPRACG